MYTVVNSVCILVDTFRWRLTLWMVNYVNYLVVNFLLFKIVLLVWIVGCVGICSVVCVYLVPYALLYGGGLIAGYKKNFWAQIRPHMLKNDRK